MTDQTGKVVAGRTKPSLVTVGKTTVLAGGRWNNDVMTDYIVENGVDDWLTVGHLAKVGCGANTIPNKKRVRARLSQMFIRFCERGLFLAIEYGGSHNSATAVKVADLESGDERQAVMLKLERMRKRKEIASDLYERSMALLHATDTA